MYATIIVKSSRTIGQLQSVCLPAEINCLKHNCIVKQSKVELTLPIPVSFKVEQLAVVYCSYW